MNKIILFFTAFILITACSQSDSGNKISSSKVNRKATTQQQMQKSQSTATTPMQKGQSSSSAQTAISDRMLLVEEVNHLHFVFEPLDITFLYPRTWEQIEEKSITIFTNREGLDVVFLKDPIPDFELENYVREITSRSEYKEESRKLLARPDGYYIKGQERDGGKRMIDHYIRAVPNKGILHLEFSYESNQTLAMDDISKQMIRSIVYNWSVISAQIAAMSNKTPDPASIPAGIKASTPQESDSKQQTEPASNEKYSLENLPDVSGKYGFTWSNPLPRGQGLEGLCIIPDPIGAVPNDLYQKTDVTATAGDPTFGPYTKKIVANGITLGSRDAPDWFLYAVADIIQEIFPKDVSNPALQQQVMRDMYRYRALIPTVGDQGFLKNPTSAMEKLNDAANEYNSICDAIWYLPDESAETQIMEVLEHVLHFITDIGLHSAMPDDWSITRNSRVTLAMIEAIEKGIYNVKDTAQIIDPTRSRIEIQEYAYWLISTAWNQQATYGEVPNEEWGVINIFDLQAKNPLGYELYMDTIPQIMSPPSDEVIQKVLAN